MVIFCLLRHWVPFAEWWWLWGTSQPRGPGRWMLDQVSAVRASACVFKANVSVINALCYFFSPPHSAFFLLCFAFHLLGWVYWFSVMQTAIKQYSSNAPEPATECAPNNLNTNQPINSSSRQEHNVPVIYQPLSPVTNSQSLLHRTSPSLSSLRHMAELLFSQDFHTCRIPWRRRGQGLWLLRAFKVKIA